MTKPYDPVGPTRADLDAMPGSVVVEFGTDWCGYCKAAQPAIDAAFADYPDVPRIRIEDGKGRRTGRSYGVKLWPTLVFLAGGKEVDRVVRPNDAAAVGRALAELTATNQSDG